MYLYIGYYILLLCNVFFAFHKTHSVLIFRLTFIFVWILYFGNTLNPDLLNYEVIYNSSSVTPDVGFRFIVQLSKYFGLDFKAFVFVISLICLLLIFYSIGKFTKNKNFVMALYMIYPFVFDIIQLRNFIAMAIVIFSIQFLLKRDMKNKRYYIIGICLASSIHILMFVYISFLFINLEYEKKNKNVKLLVMITTISCLFVFLNGNSLSFLSQITFLAPGKYLYYFTKKLGYGFLVNWFFSLLSFYMVYISRKRIKQNWNTNASNKYRLKFVDLVFWINVLSLAFFPFYMLNINFYRLYRNLSLLNYTVYAIANDSYVDSGNKGRRQYNIYIILSLSILFIYDVVLNYGLVFKPIFENNIFIK